MIFNEGNKNKNAYPNFSNVDSSNNNGNENDELWIFMKDKIVLV